MINFAGTLPTGMGCGTGVSYSVEIEGRAPEEDLRSLVPGAPRPPHPREAATGPTHRTTAECHPDQATTRPPLANNSGLGHHPPQPWAIRRPGDAAGRATAAAVRSALRRLRGAVHADGREPVLERRAAAGLGLSRMTRSFVTRRPYTTG